MNQLEDARPSYEKDDAGYISSGAFGVDFDVHELEQVVENLEGRDDFEIKEERPYLDKLVARLQHLLNRTEGRDAH